ncbi:tRNA (uracil-5-)-methyltransferase homolog A-like [Gadus chalcogrammus]|uniref:tRNA (uracil-5-)-methyltransferase homolog A-like n=1 Tax=Gadus chalcogrammus TaxID=1042646 RepID=UPI0024C3421D|nr:tRNA (uracil-5-)-methyltransferase homolog A-like [Gadus chalcogrammus]XP_056447815.1 tRNA (uracil-5-)-methyltransferase homolog A-like [Gadus chalcogrammus]
MVEPPPAAPKIMEPSDDPTEDSATTIENPVTKQAEVGKSDSEPSLYNYIKDELFTSEIYKVEIQNLPKFVGFNDLKKFLSRHGLSPHKIKLFGRQTFAFVTFMNEEERDKAMKMVHGMLWKGQVLSVRLAKPKADPIQRKRKQQQEEGDGEEGGQSSRGGPAAKRQDVEEDSEPFSVQIANVVTPLWKVPYEEQLRRKQQEVEGVLQRLAKEIGNTNKAMAPWLFAQKGKYNNMCCPLEDIQPSPSLTEYRNKCEFLISMGADGEDKTVGFRLGKYKGGSCAVVGPAETTHVSAEAKRVVAAFQKFIRTTEYSTYSPETYDGHWKQLTVRTSRTKQAMAMIYFNPQKLAEEELDALKNSLKKFFTEGEGADSGVTSLYFVREGQRTAPKPEDSPCELVDGESSIQEELLGLKFRISPQSFFQVNTAGAEVLYSKVGEWAQLDQDSTVLDVCCGTGTIGLSLAKRVKKVIGIEMCKEAVEDAKHNAKLNGLTNVEFHCGKAEDLFPKILNALVSPNVTAIVDPPRAGLHSKVVLAIRRAEHLKRLVYVSCNAKAAMANFIDLCRAPSNRVRGAPFRPVRCMAVDLFPQTVHMEMVLLLERLDYSSQNAADKQEEAVAKAQ